MRREKSLNYIFDQYERDQRRLQESRQIAEAGSLVVAVRASVNYFCGVPVETIEKVQQQTSKFYQNAGRRGRIRMIEDTEVLLQTFSAGFNPCKETDSAMNARRLTVISHIVRANIAVGDLSVAVADVIMGNMPLGIKKGELAAEVRAKPQVR